MPTSHLHVFFGEMSIKVCKWQSSYKNTSHIGLGAHLLQYHLILTNYTFNNTIYFYLLLYLAVLGL